jgi:CRP/FNR family transcriptional regulator
MNETVEHILERVAPEWSPNLRAAIAARSNRISCPDGYRLFGPGDHCENFLIPLSGVVRVEQMGATGRSVVLYRVGPGDSCVMTTSCLLSSEPYQAYGFAEGDVEAIDISAAGFRDLVNQQAEFRNIALSVFSQRIIELVEVIDQLLIHRVDRRLAAWLVKRAPTGDTVISTHQAVAGELGTAREVVSRILKEFERRGWISLSRGQVDILDVTALRVFSAET